MTDILLSLMLEWMCKCEQFIKDYQSEHLWSEEKMLYIMVWYRINQIYEFNIG